MTDRKTTDPIDFTIALVFVLDYIVKHLKRTNQPQNPMTIAIILMDFEDRFENGVFAMQRFINWMGEHGYDDDDILIALVHDLNDYRSDGFSPRTSSY